MEEMHTTLNAPFKARAFKNAHEAIMSVTMNNRVIRELADLKGIPSVGSSVLAICHEQMKTGKIAVLEEYKTNPIRVFADIYGVGSKTAQGFIDRGFKTLDDLRARPDVLNEKQKIGLKYYDDIKARIPRAMIERYEVAFRAALPRVSADTGTIQMEIVGSYRRGVQTSGDIDVIFTFRPAASLSSSSSSSSIKLSGVGLKDLYGTFIKNMVNSGIIKKEHILAYGETKCLVLAKLPDDEFYRRIDFLCTPYESYVASIQYFTGSKYFNIVMRHHILKMGYTLNEHGVYHLDSTGKKGAQVSQIFETERDLFAFFGLEYKDPIDRRDGRDVRVVG
jgi:DNA polymerase/3'-5' exonuclease PolX